MIDNVIIKDNNNTRPRTQNRFHGRQIAHPQSFFEGILNSYSNHNLTRLIPCRAQPLKINDTKL